jgi:mannosyltransferase
MNVDLTAPTRPAPPGAGPVRSPGRQGLVVAGIVLVVGVGIVLRFAARADLWLDEALAVNIAKLPLDRLRPALLHDGAPPLYYVVLHFWIRVFGSSTAAVRALSGVLGVIAIGLGDLAGRAWAPASSRARLLGALGAVVLASSPYAIHYSTEVRMYALTVVLGLLGLVLAAAAWRTPTPTRLAGITVVTAGLLYTQYWAFFLVGVIGLALAAAAVWGTAPVQRSARWFLVAMAVGVALFAPWWPTFSAQLAHTGTPWDAPTTVFAGLRRSALAFGGSGWWRWATAAGLAVFLGLGWFRARNGERTIAVLAGSAAIATVVAGVVGSVIAGSGFQDRYVAVAYPFLAVAVVFGAAAVADARVRIGAVGALAVVGLLAGWHVVRAERTASTVVAAALRLQLRAGDVVAYCPDQLGPATARLLRAGVTQLTFPNLAAPQLVDWTDYGDRNEAASGPRFADAVLGRAGTGRVFLVWSGGYRTFGTKCEATVNALTTLRPHPTDVTVADGPDGEQVGVQRFDP